MEEFARRLYVRQTPEDKEAERLRRLMFARLNKTEKPKPPIVDDLAGWCDLAKRAEARREARRARKEKES